VNVRVAGREADYVWRQWKLIVEVDSKEFHFFNIDDADKQARWQAAGYTVRRIMANDIYHHPHLLLAQVNGQMCRL
jgi:very-short-patch-repair endonuclease